MFTRFRSYLLFLLLFTTVYLNSVCLNAVLAGETFSRKIEVLRAELSTYHPSMRPNERYNAGSRLNAALLDILREEESLTANPGDILGDDRKFELKFGDWVDAGENMYRIVILNPYEINIGAMTTVFSQTRAGDQTIMAEKVHILTQTPNTGFLVHAEIIDCGNKLFLPIVEVHHGPDDKYVSIYTRRLENDKWQAHIRPLTISSIGRWAISDGNTSFSIGHPAMGWNSENDYEVKASQGDIEIRIVDKAKASLDSIKISIVAGEWIIRQ